MAQQEPKLTSPASLAIDAILSLAFFLLIYPVVSPHVQSHDRWMILLWGGLTSACLTGVFWLSIQMFRIVFRAQRASRQG